MGQTIAFVRFQLGIEPQLKHTSWGETSEAVTRGNVILKPLSRKHFKITFSRLIP